MQQEIKYGQLWARHSELVEADQVGKYRVTFEGLKKAVEEAMRIQQPNEQPVVKGIWVQCLDRRPKNPGIYKVKREHCGDEEEKAEFTGVVFHNYQGYRVIEWFEEAEQPGEQKENEAVAFAEWAGWEWRRVEGKNLWENQKTLEVIKSKDLYERFEKETGNIS